MISEFLYLEEGKRSDYCINYICYLPDPDIFGDFEMILCGYIHLQEDFASGDCTIRVELLDNFEQLCIGDTYQREHFLTEIFDRLRWNTDFSLDHAKIMLKDFMGNCVWYPHK